MRRNVYINKLEIQRKSLKTILIKLKQVCPVPIVRTPRVKHEGGVQGGSNQDKQYIMDDN